MTDKKPRLHYGWIIFICCCLTTMVSLGFCSSVKGLYLPVITEQLSIPRSLYSITDSCRYIVVSVMNLQFGRLVEKYSPRKLTALGFLALILSCLLYSAAQHVAVFYLGGCFLGLGLAWTSTTMVGYFVEKWFSKAKGTIMGIVLAANGIGGAVASQILTPMIYSAREDGWRLSYRLSALILLAVGILVVIFLRNDPSEKGLKPLGADAAAKKKRGSDWEGISAKEAFKKGYTYAAIVFIFLIGFCLQGCQACSSAHFKDIGFDPVILANMVSIQSIGMAFSKTASGFFYDRFGLRVSMLICNIGALIAFAVISLAGPEMAAAPYVYAVAFAFGLPLETIMIPLVASDLYGKKDYAHMMGILVSVSTMGFFLASPIVNLFYDTFGTYRPAFIGSAVLMLVITIGFQIVITIARKERTDAK